MGDERPSRGRESAPMKMHAITAGCIPCARLVPGRSDAPEFAGPGYTLPKDAICHRPYVATPNENAMADSPCLVAKYYIVFRSGDYCCTKSTPGDSILSRTLKQYCSRTASDHKASYVIHILVSYLASTFPWRSMVTIKSVLRRFSNQNVWRTP